jgi:hypothetical protein
MNLASRKLDLDIKLTYGYKLCDLKPAYGLIFEEYLKHYDFWGHCDLDIIWGRISHFISDDILDNFDVITTVESHTAGHFTLYKNNGITIDLFRQTDDYKKVFVDDTLNYVFDESCFRFGEFHSPEQLKQSGQTTSMTDIVMDLKAKQILRVYMKSIIRQHPDPFFFKYRDGVFTDIISSEEFMYFHLLHVKKDWKFFVPKMERLPSEFTIISEGIVPGTFGNSVTMFKWKIAKIIFSINYLSRKIKEIGFFKFINKLTKESFGKMRRGRSLMTPDF